MAGLDKRRAKTAVQTHAALRPFIGECSWLDLQLEFELAEGKWLAVSAEPAFLQQLALDPLTLCHG